MSLTPPQAFQKTAYTHRIGLASGRPAATDVLVGTLYYSTDTSVLERSNGSIWETYTSTSTGSVTVSSVIREVPTGTINGINTTFTLANIPISNTEEVYLNGLLQDTRGIDYSISGAIITFLVPPQLGDRVLVSYQRT